MVGQVFSPNVVAHCDPQLLKRGPDGRLNDLKVVPDVNCPAIKANMVVRTEAENVAHNVWTFMGSHPGVGCGQPPHRGLRESVWWFRRPGSRSRGSP